MKSYSIQNIVVPIDLSESSLNGLDTGVALLKNTRLTFVFCPLRKQCRQLPIQLSKGKRMIEALYEKAAMAGFFY
jgi:hypothetical protein